MTINNKHNLTNTIINNPYILINFMQKAFLDNLTNKITI